MSNLKSKQIKGNSIVLTQFSQYSLLNAGAIKGGVGGTGDNGGTDFIGDYINQ